MRELAEKMSLALLQERFEILQKATVKEPTCRPSFECLSLPHNILRTFEYRPPIWNYENFNKELPLFLASSFKLSIFTDQDIEKTLKFCLSRIFRHMCAFITFLYNFSWYAWDVSDVCARLYRSLYHLYTFRFLRNFFSMRNHLYVRTVHSRNIFGVGRWKI